MKKILFILFLLSANLIAQNTTDSIPLNKHELSLNYINIGILETTSFVGLSYEYNLKNHETISFELLKSYETGNKNPDYYAFTSYFRKYYYGFFSDVFLMFTDQDSNSTDVFFGADIGYKLKLYDKLTFSAFFGIGIDIIGILDYSGGLTNRIGFSLGYRF